MNTFAIRNPRELKLTDVGVLSKKDRDPGEAPGMQLSVVGDFDLGILNAFVPGLATIIFEPGEQSGFDDESNLTALSDVAKFLGELSPPDKLTGYKGHADFGAGSTKGQDMENIMLHSFRMVPKEGGGVQVKFKLDVPNCGEKVLGRFGINKSQLFELTLEPPTIKVETKPDANQIGLLGADTPPMTRTPNPFEKAEGPAADEAQQDDGIDTPAKALARATKTRSAK